jgi:hypothetical protein
MAIEPFHWPRRAILRSRFIGHDAFPGLRWEWTRERDIRVFIVAEDPVRAITSVGGVGGECPNIAFVCRFIVRHELRFQCSATVNPDTQQASLGDRVLEYVPAYRSVRSRFGHSDECGAVSRSG